MSFCRLIELDEGIEALEAAIEFKNDGIANTQKELDSSQLLTDKDRQGLANKLSNLAPGEAVSLLSKYFEKVVELRGNERKLELRCSDLEVGVRISHDYCHVLNLTFFLSLGCSSSHSAPKLVNYSQSDYKPSLNLLADSPTRRTC